MSGLYIHVPFCASRCIYCDFYSTTHHEHPSGVGDVRQAYVEALTREMRQRRTSLPGHADAMGRWVADDALRTIYLGGGTPSWLGLGHLGRVLDAATHAFDTTHVEEVTIEANPEDVARWTAEEAETLRGQTATIYHSLRVSMGVQSMVDEELRQLHRRHDAQRVVQAVTTLRQWGIDNLSLDLMYGLPGQTMDTWAYSIDRVVALRPEHISAYCLSVEEGTPLAHMVEHGEATPASDDDCLAMADLLRRKLREAGYVQYEISNFCLPHRHARHNSSYWDGTPYLGLGPGAHSYDGHDLRQWNAPDLAGYLQAWRGENGEDDMARGLRDEERLTPTDRWNERVMLGLRTLPAPGMTSWGLTLTPAEWDTHADTIGRLLARGLVTSTKKRLTLTEAGLALADEVIRALML